MCLIKNDKWIFSYCVRGRTRQKNMTVENTIIKKWVMGYYFVKNGYMTVHFQNWCVCEGEVQSLYNNVIALFVQ